MLAAQNSIKVPRNDFLEGWEFHASTIEDALEACLKEHVPVFMPQLADARISAFKEDSIWQNWYSAPSLMVTGTTKAGNNVVVFAHVPNYFSSPENIRLAKMNGLRNGAGFVPQQEFQRLLDLEDEDVFVVDYDVLNRSSSGIVSVKDALNHPLVAPFLGGYERAAQYLKRHSQVYGNAIGIWHEDDLSDVPSGRVLVLGDSHVTGLVGLNHFSDGGRFVGVRSLETTRSAAKNPTLDQVLKISGDYVPTAAKAEYEARIRALFQKTL